MSYDDEAMHDADLTQVRNGHVTSHAKFRLNDHVFFLVTVTLL